MKTYFNMLRLPQQLMAIPLLFGLLDSGIKLSTHPQVLFWIAGWFVSSIVAFFYNDYVDSFDTDQHSPDRRASKGKKINPRVVYSIIVILSLVSCILYLESGLLGFILGLSTWLIMMIYSFPSVRLKKKKYFDILDQAIAWLVIPYFMPFVLSGQAYSLSVLVSFVFLTLFLTAAAAIAPVLDISADAIAGIANTTVSWGYDKSIRAASRLFLIAFTLCLIMIYNHTNWWYWLMLPPGFMAMKVLGMGQANTDRPEKLEKIFLRAKKWGKACGWATFLMLLIILVIRQLGYV